MVMRVLENFNWVDYFILIIFLRIIYIAAKKGFTVEFFKFLGVICALYIGMHYHILVADFIQTSFPFIAKKFPVKFLDFLIFLLLVVLSNLFFVLVKIAFSYLIKIEAVSLLQKWGGLFLGIFRSVLFAAIFLYGLSISSVSYFEGSVRRSYLSYRLVSVGIATYRGMWDNIFSKFAPNEQFNKVVLEVEENIKIKK